MGFALSNRSLNRLAGIHPDLVALVKRAIQITPIDFTVLEGLRTVERQRQLVASGASQTMNSRHLTGHAVDIAPLHNGSVTWDWEYYYPLADAVKQAADDLGIEVDWGGDWTSFKDGPHWELSWQVYAKDDFTRRAKVLDSPRPEARPEPARKLSPWAAFFAALRRLFGAA